ncbi:hypothetical protein HKD37_14G040590 [Glycine soja]
MNRTLKAILHSHPVPEPHECYCLGLFMYPPLSMRTRKAILHSHPVPEPHECYCLALFIAKLLVTGKHVILLFSISVPSPSPLGPSRRFLQKAVASGGSNLARLGELDSKLLPYFAINRGRSEEEKDPSSRRLLLLEEATLLAWASWFAINRGRSEEEKGSAFLALLPLSKLLRKIVSVKKIQAEALLFDDMVFTDERIKVSLKRGKFDHHTLINAKKKLGQMKRRKPKHQPRNEFCSEKALEFTPIPVSYADLLPYLLDNSMVAITPTKVHQPPFLREYDSNATCACHGESPGHSIEHCRGLKRKVQGLIDAGWLKFEENHPRARAINMHSTRPRKITSLLFPWHTPSYGLHYWRITWWWPYPGRSSSHPTPSGTTRVPSVCTIVELPEEGPNVKTNPLASHGGASVNAIEEDGPSWTKRFGEVATSRRFIYQSLQAPCMVSRGGDERDECLFHLGESHDMETCPVVEELLQRLMDCGQLESEEKKVPLTPKALVICFTRKGTGSTPIYPRMAPKPTPFAYQSNKAVPWKYTSPASSKRITTEVDSLSAKVTNIIGLSGVTRSAAIMVARVMLRNGFEPGMGLGKDCLGNANEVDIKGNPYKYGLGYEPGMPGRRNMPSRFRADRVWPGRISQCFTSAGMVSEEEVATIEEEFPHDPPCFQSGPLGPSRSFLQKAVASGGSNLARLGKLSSPGRAGGSSEEEKGSAFLALLPLSKLLRKIVSVKKIQAEALPHMATPPSSPPPPPPPPPPSPTNAASQSSSTLKRTRKTTRLRSLATRLAGAERPVAHVDPATRKVDGPHKKKLRTYLGIVACDKVDVTYENWKQVHAAQKDLIWKDIQAEFDIPKASDVRTKKKILQTVGERWRQFKSDLMSKWTLLANKDSVDDTVCEKYNISKEKWTQFCQSHRDPSWEVRIGHPEAKHCPPHLLSRGGYEYLEKKLMDEKTKKKLIDTAIDLPSPIRRHVKWKMAWTKKTGQMTSEAAKQIADKIGSFVTHGRQDVLTAAIGQSNTLVGYVLLEPQYFGPTPRTSCTSSSMAPEDLEQLAQQIRDQLEESITEKSQIQSQGLALPPKPEVGPSAARVSTKENCVDPSGNDPDTGDSDKCGLYIEENPPRLVALGKVYEGSITVHNIPLLHDQVKVDVEEVRDADAPIPVPIEEVRLVGQTFNTFLAWPTHLIKHLSEQGAVGPTKPTDRPDHEIMWDATVFGVFNEHFPLYIKHEDLSKIAHGGQCLNISIIQLHMTERSVRAGNFDLHEELNAEFKTGCLPRSLPEWVNIVFQYICISIKSMFVFNNALKGLDDTPQPKSKAGARWIVVKVSDFKQCFYLYIFYACCNRQKGSIECGYFVMHWMSTIILGSFKNNWETTIGIRQIEGASHIVGKVLSQRLTGASSKGGRLAESPPMFIRGKRWKNRKRCGLQTLSVKGSGVVSTHGEVANCRNLPTGGRATRGSRVRLPREEGARSRHQCLFGENVRKTGKGVVYEL